MNLASQKSFLTNKLNQLAQLLDFAFQIIQKSKIMKTLKIFLAGFAMILSSSLHAQVSVSVNIGGRPDWAPVAYNEANYYYLPDVEAYYDVRSSNFIYANNGTWIHARTLPTRYRSYDLHSGPKVVLTDYRGNRPYTHFKSHKVKYYNGYHAPQTVVVKEVHHNHHQKKHKAKHYKKHHHH